MKFTENLSQKKSNKPLRGYENLNKNRGVHEKRHDKNRISIKVNIWEETNLSSLTSFRKCAVPNLIQLLMV